MMPKFDFISYPISTGVTGELTVPGDKSISHRSIIFGSIGCGVTTISGFLEGDDCLATLAAFRAMGVQIEGPIDGAVLIHGVGKHGLKKPSAVLDCGNSGTSIRLLTGLLAAQSFDTTLTGDASLLKRPMHRISRPLMQMGADVQTSNGAPPLHIKGGRHLHGICYEMPEASAQVKSCLLLAGMYASNQTIVIEPAPSRDHTERMLAAFSYPVLRVGSAITIESGHECKGAEIHVPGDLSSAAFFIVAATITPGSHIRLNNVSVNPTRTGVLDILNQMGADIQIENQRTYGEEPVADLIVRYAPLNGIEIPLSLVPLAIDEFPILFIAAACATGKTILRGARELRCKESDRISTMAEGLQQLGIEATPQEDGIIIQGGYIKGGTVASKNDHRVAMSFAIAGAVAASPIHIQDCYHVATSFPGFVHTANKGQLNIHIKQQN